MLRTFAPAHRLVALLLAAGCAGYSEAPSAPAADRGSSPLVAAFEQASRDTGVPADLLMAIGYVESRFSQRGGQPSRLQGYGVMHLRAGATLDLAAERLERTPADLQLDAAANIRGAAEVLALFARDERGALPGALSAWRPALERYCGLGELAPEYSAEVLRVLAVGAEGTDEAGRRLAIPAHPEVGLVPLGDGLGQASFAATPDYSAATWLPSPNYSSRNGTAIDMVVIHTCQGGFSGCSSWLRDPTADASAHYVVSSAEGKIHQLVEERNKAWHATCVNPRSVGIEHEGYVEDPAQWYTDTMYCASAKLVRSICDRNGIPCDRAHVIGHKEANERYCGPGHTDPGPGWNWTKFMGYVNNGCGGTGTGRLLGYVYKKPTNDAASRLAGATVKLSSGASTTTNSSGLYSFSIAPGSYTVTASASGYQEASISRAVTAGADTWGSVGLDAVSTIETGCYYGTVYEVNEANPADMTKRLPGAAVSLDTGATATSRAGDGVFKFDDVPVGTRTATASLAGYKTNSSTKTVVVRTDPTACATWGSIGLVKDGGTVIDKPVVKILSPANGATLDEAQFDLRGQVDSAGDAKTVKVQWAGTSVDAPLGAGSSFNVPVKVPSGDTTITVSATNGGGSHSASVSVHFKSGLCGFVYQLTGGASARIGGANVELIPAADLCAQPIATATSQSPDGRWCVDVAPGDYYLRVRAAEHMTSFESVTVSADQRDSTETGLVPGADPTPTIELTDPLPGADGKLHTTKAAFSFVASVRGLLATGATVNGLAAKVLDNTITATDVALEPGENAVAVLAQDRCGVKASLTILVLRETGSSAPDAGEPIVVEPPDAGAADAGGRGDAGPLPVKEDDGCGCATGGEGLALAGLFALTAALRRRRLSPG